MLAMVRRKPWGPFREGDLVTAYTIVGTWPGVVVSVSTYADGDIYHVRRDDDDPQTAPIWVLTANSLLTRLGE